MMRDAFPHVRAVAELPSGMFKACFNAAVHIIEKYKAQEKKHEAGHKKSEL